MYYVLCIAFITLDTAVSSCTSDNSDPIQTTCTIIISIIDFTKFQCAEG